MLTKKIAEYKQFSAIHMKYENTKEFCMYLLIYKCIKIGIKYVWKWKKEKLRIVVTFLKEREMWLGKITKGTSNVTIIHNFLNKTKNL